MAESTFLDPARALSALKLHDGLTVADLGAGSGFFTRAAAREVAPSEVWAVDINRDLLPRIKNLALAEGLRNIQVVQGDISTQGGSNLPPEHFDVVILSNVLFSTEHKDTALSEAYRILKKRGRALIVDWKGSFGGLGPHEDHVFGEREARKLLDECGWVILEEAPAGEYHWGLVVRKADMRVQ